MDHLMRWAILAVVCIVVGLILWPRRRRSWTGSYADQRHDRTEYRVLQDKIWGQFHHYGTWSVCRSGATVEEMEQHLREELERSLHYLPGELHIASEPVIEHFEHQPGKTYDGRITVKLRRVSKVA